ncbi:MerR family transcriptional regulator [Mechercharimyces sp. CAU 1602]|uniref:MerR family transcriptional regulator n=1 Tax=Mechercharimyces sp. CAU 1602 TaxID=2973933 RepID=UPI00216211EA|nr:MerR family transcriptional regulator [Mechercharimyces sp. CAU 1602]MCS1352344.1 MerR family transcriptional regulator [Mechercharimyces sp. CAU 1602]
MFRIGQFSKLTRVSTRMLRHYDKLGLFCPAEIDRFTGYRLYSAFQIPLLNRIVKLRDMGFSVNEMNEIIDKYDNKVFLHTALNSKLKQIRKNIDVEHLKHERLTKALNELEEDNMKYSVELKKLPLIKVFSLKENISDYNKEIELWERLNLFCTENNIQTTDSGIYSIYYDDEHKECDVEMEVAVPVKELLEDQNPFTYKELPEIPYAATIRYTGSYENIMPAMTAIAEWIEQNKYEIIGYTRGYGIKHPENEQNPYNFVTEIQIPVRKM